MNYCGPATSRKAEAKKIIKDAELFCFSKLKEKPDCRGACDHKTGWKSLGLTAASSTYGRGDVRKVLESGFTHSTLGR